MIGERYTLREVATAAGLRYSIARKLASQGIIRAKRVGLGYYRVSEHEMRRLVKRYGKAP